MNILLTTLSAFNNSRLTRFAYEAESLGKNGPKMTLDGYFSGEAPVRYLIQRLYSERYVPFDKVIVLSTDKCAQSVPVINAVLEKETRSEDEQQFAEHLSARLGLTAGKAAAPVSTEDYIRRVIVQETRAVLPRAETADPFGPDSFLFINTDREKQDDLLQSIYQQAENDVEANIYVDLTGGSRVQGLMAVMVIAWLEAKNYHVSCVVYANINNIPATIDDITSVYQCINAVVANAKKHDAAYMGNSYAQDIISGSYNFRLPEETDTIKKKMNRIAAPYSYVSEGAKPFIFLSYAHADVLAAQSILKQLTDRGFRIWYDEAILTGKEWERQIYEAIDHAFFTVVLLSHKYLTESTYCAHEIDYILKGKGRDAVYLINLDDTREKDIPAAFSDLQKHFHEIQFLRWQQQRPYEAYDKLEQFLKKRCADCCGS